MVFPDLAPALGSIEWAVTGAAAARLNMPKRATRDLDVVIRAEDGPRAQERLRSAGVSYLGEPATGGSTWRPGASGGPHRAGAPLNVAVSMLSTRALWGAG